MIIAITGTHGAGKGTVVEYLKTKRFIHLSASDLIITEVKRRGLEVNRPNISATVTDMRNKVSPLWVVETLYSQANERGGDAVIESIYTLDEEAFLRDKGAILFAVDADLKIRFERIQKRGSAKDNITFEEFESQQRKEMASDDPNSQNVHVVMKRADYIIMNNGTPEELYNQVEKVLASIG